MDDQLFELPPERLTSTGGDAERRTQQARAETYPRELYDGRPPAERDETSRAAGDSMTKVAGKLQRQVLDTISRHPGGLTCDRIEELLGGRHQTISARVRELVLLGKIEKAGKRQTRSGRLAWVYVVR